MKNSIFYLLLIILALGCKTEKEFPALTERTQALRDANLKPFYHGVASGDPTQTAVVIWTRVSPDVRYPEIVVEWELGLDKDFKQIESKGKFITNPERDYTVKVDVQNLLPGTTYYYRFKALHGKSIVGRTKTAPSNADSLKFAVASCSSYQWGYFNSYGRIAEEEDLAAVIHLGDYIYEHGEGGYGDTTIGRIHVPDYEILNLRDYRDRYSQYRLDPDLRAAHQQHPFITVWDDHEITNNAYKDGAQNHQPDEGDYYERRSVARQVYYEWLPIRENNNLYRSISFGEMADLIMLDGRLAGRTRQADSLTDPRRTDPEQSMLGKEQLNWFNKTLTNSDSKWKLIGNQVIFSYQDWGYESFGLNMDSWDGYPLEQQKIVDMIRENAIDNVVFITGDTHSSWAFESTNNPFESYNRDTAEGAVAVEFGVTSLNSANSDERFPADSVKAHEIKISNSEINPHLKYVNMRDHGYLLLTLTNDYARGDFKIISTTRSSDTGITTDASYQVFSGSHKLEKLK